MTGAEGWMRRRERERMREWKDIVMLPVERLSNHYLMSSTIKLPILILHNTSATIQYSHIIKYKVHVANCYPSAFHAALYHMNLQDVKRRASNHIFHLRILLIFMWHCQCGLQHLCQAISIWKAFGAPVHLGSISADSALTIPICVKLLQTHNFILTDFTMVIHSAMQVSCYKELSWDHITLFDKTNSMKVKEMP